MSNEHSRYEAAIRGEADEPAADEVVDGLRAEVERLRAANAVWERRLAAVQLVAEGNEPGEDWEPGYKSDALQRVVSAQREHARLIEQREDMEQQLRSAIEAGKRDTALLKWFEDRETALQHVLREPGFPSAWARYHKWARDNPKPGAAT